MAIKFSQFTVRTNSSDLSHIVGYNGVDNIQITPTNFLNSALTGTAGQVLFYDTTGVAGDNDLYWDNTNKRLGIGTNSPTQTLDVDGAIITEDYRAASIFYLTSGGDWRFRTATGSERIRVTSAGNVGIGTSSPSEKLEVVGNIKVGDSQSFLAGASDDLKIIHNGTFSSIQNNTGDLKIINYADDKDIVFESDNGSGGTAEYFRLDGSRASGAYTYTTRPDGGVITFGDSLDLRLWHDPNTNESYMRSYNNNLNIEAITADTDILFKADNGSGGTTTYFTLDGSLVQMWADKDIQFSDNIKAKFGGSSDLQIYHNGTNSLIDNTVGDISIRQLANDKDIRFRCDDGSGGETEYFRLDGSSEKIIYSKNQWLYDNIRAVFGSSDDLQIYHNGTNSLIENSAGDLYISNKQDDGDIIFFCDDGSGGTTEYLRLDGGNTITRVSRNFRANDNVALQVGVDGDAGMYHDGTDTYFQNDTGNLILLQNTNDGDIIFRCDDGSGGTTEYYKIDGGSTLNIFYKPVFLGDGVKSLYGNSSDLQIYHDGSNSFIDDTGTGILYIRAAANMYFQTYGSGKRWASFFENQGIELFYNDIKKLETTSGGIQVTGEIRTTDYIVHTGDSDTYFGYNGDNSFELVVGGTQKITADSNAAYLRYQGTTKLETRSTGIKISGVSEYADNTAAIAGGLTTGDVYRTGDLLKIVH